MKRHAQKPKQKELNKYLATYKLPFSKLVELTESGIKKRDKGHKVSGAFRNGSYLGCPGKDIHFALMKYLSSKQEDRLVEVFASIFPTHSTNHEHLSCALRYIYGCFDKQGCLLSKKHQNVIAGLKWEKPERFVDKLQICFEDLDNPFGLLILHEMKAHRLGDKAIVTKNLPMMDDMIGCYDVSVSYLQGIKKKRPTYVYRHTPYFWCACYLERYDKAKAVTYHLKNLRLLEKNCTDGRRGYRKKVEHSVKYIKRHVPPKKWKKLWGEISKYKKQCFASVKPR